MKILHIIDNLFIGGKERQLVELLAGLEARGDIKCEVLVLSDNIYYPYLDNLTTRVHAFPRKNAKDPRVVAKLREICKRFQPDIIQTWEFMCSVYAAPICKLNGIKFINGAIQNAPEVVAKKSRFRSRLTFPLSDVILANSDAGLRAFGVNSPKMHYIHAGFDFSRIQVLEDEAAVRQEFGLHTPHVVGMIATFSEKKDYPAYLRAAMKILDKRDDVTFVTIGIGPMQDACKKMVPEKYRERIKFLGKVKYIEPIVNTFRVGVLATFTEGISNTIMEFMALEKPVVATDGGGTKELLVDGKTGLLTKVSDVADLAEKIEFFLDNEAAAKKMGKAGKERLLKEFSLEVMTGRFVDLYRRCLNLNGKH